MKLQKVQKAWFDFPEDPDNAKFEIKNLRAGEISKIEESTRVAQFEYKKNKKGKLEAAPFLKMNAKKEKELTIVEVITNWENIFDENGEALKCNKKNKIRLCNELSENDFILFAQFIQESRTVLAKDIKKEEEKNRGN